MENLSDASRRLNSKTNKTTPNKMADNKKLFLAGAALLMEQIYKMEQQKKSRPAQPQAQPQGPQSAGGKGEDSHEGNNREQNGRDENDHAEDHHKEDHHGDDHPKGKTKKPPMTKKKKLVLAGAVLLMLIGVGYFVWDRYTYIYTDDATIQAHTTLLSPKVNGIVVQVNVDEHQRVKAGQVLVQLEQKDYRAALANAEATLEAIQAQYRNAQLDYNRNLSLIRQKAITRQAYDRAESNFKDLDRRVRAAQANVDQAKLNLDYTLVRAPTDGTIARKSVEAGMFANVGTSLFGFVQDDDRWVIANYKETDLDAIVPGKTAEVEVDALPGKTYEGYVESISPSTGAIFTLLPPDNATGNFTKVVQRVPVKVRLKNLSEEDMERLQAGLSAEVNILKHSRPQRVPPQRPTPSYLSEDEPQTGGQAAGQSSAHSAGK